MSVQRPLQPLQSGINLCRQAEPHYSLAAQILVSHSNDDSLSHTMSSASFQPLYNFRPIEQRCVLRGHGSPRPPGPTWLCLPRTWRRSLVPPSSSRLSAIFFLFFFVETHTLTNIPTSHRSECGAPHCALPDSRQKMFSTCQVAVAAVQLVETTTKQ